MPQSTTRLPDTVTSYSQGPGGREGGRGGEGREGRGGEGRGGEGGREVRKWPSNDNV